MEIVKEKDINNDVYIDFEAISAPMSWECGSPNDLPFAYSILNVKTGECIPYVVNFKKVKSRKVYTAIRDSINEILAKWEIKEPVFVTWNGGLERKILKLVYPFKGFKTRDQYPETKIFSAKLSKMSYGFESADYFMNLGDIIAPKAFKRLSSESMRRGKMTKSSGYTQLSSGALASVIGAYLYAEAYKEERVKQIVVNPDKSAILKELESYSMDDTLRMKWINDNKELCEKRYKTLNEFYCERDSALNSTMRLYGSVMSILNIYKDKTIDEIMAMKDENVDKNKDDEFDQFLFNEYSSLIDELKEEEKTLEIRQKRLSGLSSALKLNGVDTFDTVRDKKNDLKEVWAKKVEDLEISLFGVSGELLD